MKSSLKFDLDGSNEPVITSTAYYESDDLRDKVADRFFTRFFGGPGSSSDNSKLCFVECTDFTQQGQHSWQIHPIPMGQEDKFINRLSIPQCKRIIPLAFQVLSNEDVQEVLQKVPSRNSKLGDFLENRLPSRYQIEDAVSTEDIFDGEITAVRFTIGKVYYDILDKLSGKVIRDVDSALVTGQESIPKLSQA